MKLIIRFSGLFLYVPRGKQLYVLSPLTGWNQPIPVEPHEVKLQVFHAYLRGSAAPQKREFDLCELESRRLEIGDAGNPTAQTQLTRELADVKDLGGGTLSSRVFDAAPVDTLASQVVLNAGSQCAYRAGTTFLVRRRPRTIASEIFWELDMPSSFSLTLKGYGTASDETVDLKTDQPSLCLSIFHVPKHHLPQRNASDDHHPHEPPPRTPTPHFGALFSLYDGLQEMGVPLYDSGFEESRIKDSKCAPCTIETPGEGEMGHGVKAVLGGDPVTCVGGTDTDQ